jgi:signal peptidase
MKRGPGSLLTEKRMAGWVSWVGMLFLSSIIITAAVLLFLGERWGKDCPVMAGVRLMVVVSGSMKPTFDTGALIAARETDPGMLAVGDIITFHDLSYQERLITHRIVEIEETNGVKMFITQGDANGARDFSPVPERNVVGKVFFSVPYLGFIVYYIQKKIGLLLVLILIVFLAWEIIPLLRNRKKGALKES